MTDLMNSSAFTSSLTSQEKQDNTFSYSTNDSLERQQRRTNSRRLATEKNRLKKKEQKLSGLTSLLQELQSIKKRGYRVQIMEDGSRRHIKLDQAEREFISIKINDLKLERLTVGEDLADIKGSLISKAKTTKNISLSRLKEARKITALKKKAKRIIRDNMPLITAASKNGHKEMFNQIKDSVKRNESDKAMQSLMEFFSKEMLLGYNDLTKDETLKDTVLEGILKEFVKE
ncbi:MAG: hypothetical protein ACM3MI_09695 [Clostridiales bacterium]